MGLDFLVPIFGILLLLVPITGLTAILTLRLGGKPFVETLALHMKGGKDDELQERVAELTEQVESLTAEVHELRSARAFDEKLLGSSSESSNRD